MNVPQFGVQINKNKAITNRIKAWVEDKWHNQSLRSSQALDTSKAHQSGVETVQVMVTELQCFDPDCVPLETLIVVMGEVGASVQANGNMRRWSTKLLKSVVEVTIEDIEQIQFPLTLDAVDVQRLDTFAALDGCIRRTSDVDQLNELKEALIRRIQFIDSGLTKCAVVDVNAQSMQTDDPQATVVTMVHMEPMQSTEHTRSSSNISSISNNKTPESQPTASIIKSNNSNSKLTPASSVTEHSRKKSKTQPIVHNGSTLNSAVARHENKGVRQRGCPCCDPDAIENIVDRIMFLDYPPN